MSAGAGSYDLSTLTLSPDGRIFQVEYASKVVEKSGTAVGIRCADGVVLGVEKLLPAKMMLRSSSRRISAVDTHAGLSFSGLSADARQLVNRARSEARNFRRTYGSPATGSVLAARVAAYMHAHTLYWSLRPFGCSVLLATYDSDGPELYQIDPSGVVNRYFASAVGKHMRAAKSELEKINFETMACRDAVKEVARIIYKVHNDIKDKDFELELSWLCDESGRKQVMVPDDVRDEAITLAKEAKRRAEIDSDDDDSDDDDDEEEE